MTTVPLHASPDFAHDPWVGPGAPLGVGVELDAATSLYTGADALTGDIVLLPSGLNVYASYVDNYGGWGQLVSRFGKSGAFLLSITIFGNYARCADLEPGAMSVGSVNHWLDNVAPKDDYLPWVYTSASNLAEVNRVIGNRKVIRWSAHYGHGPHVCGPHTCGYPQADWTQWTDVGAHGENIDRSVGLMVPHKPAPPSHHYERFATGPFTLHGEQLNERATVQHYDRLRAIAQPTAQEKAQLAISKIHLLWLAQRVYDVAHNPLGKNGRPTWDEFNRGWRYQNLIRRAQGQKF